MLQFPQGVGQENLEYFRENPLDHIGLVVSLAEDYLDRDFEFDDLVGYGIVGLLKACQHYDKTLGFKFSTYARYWIQQEINRAFRTELSFIQVPEYMYTRSGKVDRGEIELEPESMEYLEAARKIWRASFLGIARSDDDRDPSGNDGVIPIFPVQKPPEEREDYTFLQKALTKLEVREQRVMILLFFQGMTIKRTAEITGLCKDTVRQIKNRALQKLRERLGAVEV